MADPSIIVAAFNDFRKALEPRSEPCNNEGFQALVDSRSNPWRRVKSLVDYGNIAEILNTKWETSQRQPSPPTSLYQFVTDKLNSWSKESELPKVSRVAVNNPLVGLSAEIWFLSHFSDLDVNSQEIFDKFFNNLDRRDNVFERIVNQNEHKLLRAVLKIVHVKNKLSVFLESWRAVHKLTKHELSREIWSTLEVHSKTFSITPTPSESFKMYAMHFYTRNFKNDGNGARREHSIKEAKEIRKTLKQSFGFTLRGPDEQKENQFNPETGEFDQLESWLKIELKRIRNQCSLLVVSFALHGSLGYVKPPYGVEGHKQDMVKLIHDHCDPRVPKVIIFQVCRRIPVGNNQSFHEKMDQEFIEFIETETENMQVLMAANKKEKDECPLYDSYIYNFVEGLLDQQDKDKPPIVLEAHNYAQHAADLPDEEKDKKAKDTKLMNSACRQALLPPRKPATADPVHEDEGHSDPEDEGHSDPEDGDKSNQEDDGYNLLDFADNTVPSRAEEDFEDDIEQDTYIP